MLRNSNSSTELEGSALVARAPKGGGDKKEKPYCDYCKKFWHTKEACWKLHGKPPGTGGMKKSQQQALQTVSANSQEPPVNSESSPFTKEQLEHLYKLFQSPKISVNPICSFTQTGNHFVFSLSHVKSNCSWIMDSGATDHMTSCSSLFLSYNPCAGNKRVRIADGSLSSIAGTGNIRLSPTLVLLNVLHVPKLSCNLISISKLSQDLNCCVKFSPSHCVFQDLDSGKTIGNARECDGLYVLEEGSQSHVLSITYVKGGTALNVIPSYVELGGSLRSLTTQGMYKLQKRLKEVIEGQAAVHGCKAYVDLKEQDFPLYPACWNDDSLHNHVESVGRLLLGPGNVKEDNKVMAGEDFAFYQELIPGVMFSIGIRNDKVGSIHSPHSPYFFLDEDVLPIGAALHTAIAEMYVNGFRRSDVP